MTDADRRFPSIVLPGMRLAKIRERFAGLGLDKATVNAAMRVIDDELEHDARRIGVLCPADGCRQLLEEDAVTDGPNVFRGFRCRDHGYVSRHDGPFALVVAFDPYGGTR